MRHRVPGLAALLAIACAAAPARPPASDVAAGNPLVLAYAEVGDGKPVVLLHGAFGDLRTFRRALPILAATHRVIVPSLRYHWPNPWPSDDEAYREYTVDNHARDVAALIERIGAGPVDLVAHSYGGNVAVVLATSRPELVRRLVLLEPAVGWLLREVPGGDQLLAQGTYAGARRDGLLARLRGGEAPVSVMRSVIDGDRPGNYDALPAYSRLRIAENARLVGPYASRPAFDMPFTCADAALIRQPLLLVRGDRTSAAFRETVSRFAACSPGARTEILPGSSHLIQLDAPEAMARAVAAFLDG